MHARWRCSADGANRQPPAPSARQAWSPALPRGPRSSHSTVPCARARPRKGIAAICRPGPLSARLSPADPGARFAGADRAPPATAVRQAVAVDAGTLAGIPAAVDTLARARPYLSVGTNGRRRSLFRYRQTPANVGACLTAIATCWWWARGFPGSPPGSVSPRPGCGPSSRQPLPRGKPRPRSRARSGARTWSKRAHGPPGGAAKPCPSCLTSPPDGLNDLGIVAPCPPDRLPPGFTSGWHYSAPLAHMPTYLGYLLGRFETAGGRVETATVGSLPGAARESGARVVVNCAGMGARRLVPDPEVTPYRGQVVVAANPGISEFFIGPADAAADLVYLFPHGDTVVLGGTEVAGDWNTEPVPALADRILRDCTVVEPRLRGAQILDHRVGLRPYRPQIRLETEPAAQNAPHGDPPHPLVVHNYGHGGAGVTMSWGCAREAAALVTEALSANA